MAFACNIPAVSTVQQDDENLRITRWDIPPGAVPGWHAHGWPYLVVMLTDATLSIHNGMTVTDTPLVAGQSYQRPPGIQHDVMNSSPHPAAFVEIEIKRPEAIRFDPIAGKLALR
jgi:quercetin dioxygenase-like cupin family protein